MATFAESWNLECRILKVVYFPSSTILQVTVGSHPSQIWRAILEGRDILKQGLVRRIGNSETTEIWNQNWLPRPEIMIPYICIAANPTQLVSELIDRTSATWIGRGSRRCSSRLTFQWSREYNCAQEIFVTAGRGISKKKGCILSSINI